MNLQQSNVRLGDPHICSDAQNRLNIFSAIFNALVRRDDRGQFQPALATDWRVSADARAWTFTLRENVRCHSGARISAHDAAASLRRACDPAVGGELGTEGVYASYLGDADIDAIDGQTLRIVTGRPMADLLDLLVDIPILSPRGLAGLPTELIGTGPYRLLESSPERVVLEAFADYWGGAPQRDRLVWQAVLDEAARIENLLAGRADLITDVSPAGGRQIMASTGSVMYHTQPSNLCVLFMCNARAGLCTDRRVRQALNHALDVPAMIQRAVDGAAQPLNGPLTPLHFGHDAQISALCL
ncbi:MAG: ABC transporter substrate-binding protein [Caldilineaceae bacterium]